MNCDQVLQLPTTANEPLYTLSSQVQQEQAWPRQAVTATLGVTLEHCKGANAVLMNVSARSAELPRESLAVRLIYSGSFSCQVQLWTRVRRRKAPHIMRTRVSQHQQSRPAPCSILTAIQKAGLQPVNGAMHRVPRPQRAHRVTACLSRSVKARSPLLVMLSARRKQRASVLLLAVLAEQAAIGHVVRGVVI